MLPLCRGDLADSVKLDSRYIGTYHPPTPLSISEAREYWSKPQHELLRVAAAVLSVVTACRQVGRVAHP